MPRPKNAAEFNTEFNNYLGTNPLNFNAINSFLDQYCQKEQITGPANKLKSYLQDIRNNFNEIQNEEEEYDAYTNFDTLKKSEQLLYDFLGKYGFDLSDNPLVESLAKFNNKIQIMGMSKGSIEYSECYNSPREAIRIILGTEGELGDDIKELCSSTLQDGIRDIGKLPDILTMTEQNIIRLKKQIEKDTKDIEDYKLMESRFLQISNEIENDPDLKKNQRYAEYFGKLMKAFNPQEKTDLPETDKKIEDLNGSIIKLEAQIESTEKYINENFVENKQYHESSSRLDYMYYQKEMAANGLTPEKLLEKHATLEAAFGNLSILSLNIQQGKTTLKKELKKNPEFKESYQKSKEDIIKNFSDDPVQAAGIKEMFSKIESDGGANALDLLVVHNLKAFKANLDNIKADAKELKSYLESVNISSKTKDQALGLESAKENLTNAKKELEECKASLNKTLQTRQEQRKAILNDTNFPKEDIGKLKDLSNKEFFDYLKSRNAEYNDKCKELLTTGSLSDKISQLNKMSEQKSLHKASDLEKQMDSHQADLNKSLKAKERIEKYIKTQNSLIERTEELTDRGDQICDDINNLKIPDKYSHIKESLNAIKDRLGKLQKGSSNTSYYEDMHRQLEATITAINNGDSAGINAAFTKLATDTKTYITEKENQVRLFPSPLRKLRLNAARDIQEICKSTELLNGEFDPTKQSACNKFAANYAKRKGKPDLIFEGLKERAMNAINKEKANELTGNNINMDSNQLNSSMSANM